MPSGNSHYLPSGIWWTDGKHSSVPRLLLKTVGQFSLLISGALLLGYYRELNHRIAYNDFAGKTMSLGTLTTATHEPLSVEEVDRLKREMNERKKARLGIKA